MRFILLLCTTLWSLTASAEIATIHLTDGSTIKGEVRSLKGGNYTIYGSSLGKLEIPQEQVRLVQYGGTTLPSDPELSGAAVDMQSLQSRMMENPNIMSMIRSLQDDPALQAIAADPDIQRAISAGDYTSLMNNPKILQLMEHSTVKAISREVRP